MAFGKKGKPSMVYEYGGREPIRGKAELLEEIRNRNNLWNKLVEIDRQYDKMFQDLHCKNAEEAGFNRDNLEALEQEVSELYDQVDRLKREIKIHKESSVEVDKAEIGRLESERKSIESVWRDKNDILKKTKKSIRGKCPDAFIGNEKEKKEVVVSTLPSFNLWWCNYGDEFREYDEARKRIMAERAKGKRVSLQFHSFDGSGKVTVRLRDRGTTGEWKMPTSSVFTPNKGFWIEPVPEDAWDNPSRAYRRKALCTKAHFRIASTKSKDKDEYVVLPIVMHRPLPADTKISQVSIIRSRVGRKYHYKLVITVEKPERQFNTVKEGAVAIDIGWRKLHIDNEKEAIRVACWVDSDGNRGEVRLNEKLLGAFAKIKDLRSIRDKKFDAMKDVLSKFLKQGNVPDWLRENTKSIDLWRSQRKLIRVLREWQKNPFPSGHDVFLELQEWHKKENHLYDWEANLRDKTIRHRREEYRKIAKEMADKYACVIFEDFDLSKMAEKKQDNKDKKASKGRKGIEREIGHQRVIGASSTLRSSIINAFQREGGDIIKVPAGLTTQRCHSCGHCNDFDAAKDIYHKCVKCNERWDQDYNACSNMLSEAQKTIPGFPVVTTVAI